MRRLPALLGLTLCALLPAQAVATSASWATSGPGNRDEFVLQITDEGGFVPQEIAFVQHAVAHDHR